MLLLEQDEFREQKSLFGVITEEETDDLQAEETRPVRSLFDTEPYQGETEMQTLTWLLWRDKLAGLGALIAGLFFIASAISLAIGIVLIPFSLFGLIVLIGALGFTPFFTSVIFLRNGVRAMRAAKVDLPQGRRIFAAILGGIWGLTIPYALNVEVTHSIDLIARGTPNTIRLQGLKLRLLAPLVDPGQLQKIYLDLPQNSAERSEVGHLYFQLTGQPANEYPRFDF